VLVHPFTVTERLYVPEFVADALLITGFCCVEVKPFGPVHEYEAPVRFAAFSNIDDPEHNGEFADDIGEIGIKLTTTFWVAAALVHPATVAVTEYVPL
jgi:hypothetical protein